MPAEKEPWLKFWVDDWLCDLELRRCSPAARGLWIDMICLMHKSKTYGHLSNDLREVAGYAQVSAIEAKRLLGELETRNIFSRTDTGVIFSRKMVRDDKRRSTLRENGSRGGPKTWRRLVNPALNQSGSPTTEPATPTPIASGLLPLASDPGSEGKTAPDNSNAAEIPSLTEVIDYGNGAVGIPPEFCTEFWQWRDERPGSWLFRGELGEWRKILKNRWADARQYWRPKKTPEGDEKNAAMEDIRAELQWQKDGPRLAVLVKQLRELEGKR